ncbi:discoidin domain-containing protein [Flavilitoribacter nigricans]|uniref:F5/8 type C domain-containing protein n=1 Tax=Flavilitoribacter nigricans (strain ATCC 23147 / DSM 23189 / NBRC 102662 / NCIMB 1420 / SS-2) TaxID=1122177 RepID=A0A2D0NHC3_FLAN2|nr:discoidin domain-containing protein [Flavilitoribacter nigricans]PHN07885.1 hypothetical protein CRP01_03795 [Flavilitoribacter nigricans DSM 23189 = NBRC 102662]
MSLKYGFLSGLALLLGLNGLWAQHSSLTNLALHRPAFASNESGFETPANRITDGNDTSLWGAGVRPAWIYVDLGRTLSFTEVIIQWHQTAFPENYLVEASDDCLVWESLYRVFGNDGTPDTIGFNARRARYLRVLADGPGLKTGTAIYELQILGPPVDDCTRPLRGITLLNPIRNALNPGDTYQLRAALQPVDYCDQSLRWSSSDPNVATVDESGRVTALAPGSSRLTVESFDGTFSDTCRLEVANDHIKVWQLSGDYGIIQAENAQIAQYGDRSWTIFRDAPGFSGTGYARFQGPSMWPEPRSAYDDIPNHRKLTFYVQIPDSSVYYYSIYTYHEKFDGDNDYWRSINWDFWRKTGNNLEKQWSWAGGPCGWYRIEGPGPHSIEIAGRSNGMGIDRIAFYRPEVSPEPDSCRGDLQDFRWAQDTREMSSTFVSDKVAPGTPRLNPEDSEITDSQIRVRWRGVRDDIRLAGYLVYLNDQLIQRLPAAETNYRFVGLDPGQDYTVAVEAVDWVGNRSRSEAITLRTPAANAPDTFALLLDLVDELAARESRPLFRHHFESIARISRDTAHGFGVSEADREAAAAVFRFLQDEGAQWETYAAGPRPLMMAFPSPSDGLDSYYWLFLPRDFDPNRKDYPLYFELHGSGGGRNNNPRKMLYQPLQPQIKGVPSQGYRKEGIYVLPWGRGDRGYRDQAETDIFEVLADVDRRFPTDPARQYLYGFSMGGAGTFRIAQKSLDRWAAIGVYSGAMRNPTLEEAKLFQEIPVWMTWGEEETRLTEVNRKLKDLFETAGVELKWTEVKGVGHRYLGEYQEDLMEWLKEHRKDN